jgi:hypothetical protein
MVLRLSRKYHDVLLDYAPSLLSELFAKFSASWSLAGVAFHGVDADTVQLVDVTLIAFV